MDCVTYFNTIAHPLGDFSTLSKIYAPLAYFYAPLKKWLNIGNSQNDCCIYPIKSKTYLKKTDEKDRT